VLGVLVVSLVVVAEMVACIHWGVGIERTITDTKETLEDVTKKCLCCGAAKNKASVEGGLDITTITPIQQGRTKTQNYTK